MLDTFAPHQACGLQSDFSWQDVKLCAIADSSTAAGADLLWPLAAQLQQLGYPVLVLDASQAETAQTPGLRDLLAEPAWQAAHLSPRAGQASIAALPSAHGLRQIRSLEQLQPYARRYAVVMVHASVEQLAPLLATRAMRVLLPLDMQPQGMVRNYQQIKHLAVHAGLPSIIAASTEAHESFARNHAQTQMASLAHCAQQHLRMPPLCTHIAPSRAPDLRRLALLLLAHSASLAPTGLQSTHSFSPPAWSQ